MFFARHWPEIIILLAVSVVFALYVVKYSDVAMRLWQDFLDSFDSQGGHLLLLAVLLLVLPHLGLQDAQKFEGEVIGALLMGLSAARSNKTRRDSPTPIAQTSTSTETVTTKAVTESPKDPPKE